MKNSKAYNLHSRHRMARAQPSHAGISDPERLQDNKCLKIMCYVKIDTTSDHAVLLFPQPGALFPLRFCRTDSIPQSLSFLIHLSQNSFPNTNPSICFNKWGKILYLLVCLFLPSYRACVKNEALPDMFISNSQNQN